MSSSDYGRAAFSRALYVSERRQVYSLSEARLLRLLRVFNSEPQIDPLPTGSGADRFAFIPKE